MTAFCVLFANVAKGEWPVIISDVLVTEGVRRTVDGQRYQKKYIPSIGGIFPQISHGASIAGLVQKTYVFGNGNCLVLAGDFEPAANFFMDIRSKNDVADVVKVCVKYKQDLQFAILIADEENEKIYLCATESCRQLEPGSYGTVIVGGSGEASLRKLLTLHQMRPFKVDPEMEPVARALCLINEALDMDESDPAGTLGERFGAYYEIAAFNGSGFTKIGNVAQHYLTARFVGEETHWILRKSYYHEYLGNDLIVRRVSWGCNNAEPVVWQDCYVIGGLTGSVNTDEAKRWARDTAPTTSFEVLCLEIGDSKLRLVSERQHLVKIRKDGDKWFASFDEEAAADISRTIAAALPVEHISDALSDNEQL